MYLCSVFFEEKADPMNKIHLSIAFLLVLWGHLSSFAQTQPLWQDISEAAIPVRAERVIQPAAYRTLSLAFRQMQEMLDEAPQRFTERGKPLEVSIPWPDGEMKVFEVWYAPVMHPDLAARYPKIKTFAGRQKGKAGNLIRLDYGPLGFHAMVLTTDGPDVFIDPWQKGDTEYYISYFVKDFYAAADKDFLCTTYELPENQALLQNSPEEGIYKAGDCQLRKYRLALACTGEYANYHGSNTTNNDKGPAIAAMNTTMNRVNGVFERDASITMELVPNNDVLVYLDPATDPYSNNNSSAMLSQNQTTCDTEIGSANYDIGHVFGTGNGGVAYLESPCVNGFKAGGVTGRATPVGDPFDIDYVAHEMGHQYGGRHTQNNDCNRDSQSSYEPGSASTIMGYAGICPPDIQAHSDDYYHLKSLLLMGTFVTGAGNSCATIINTSNTAPVANAGMDYTIPKSTPFKLTGSATDSNDPAGSLTYCWEQYDKEVATMPPVSTSTVGPMFRSLNPVSSPSRYLPQLSDVIAGSTPTWEVLPSVGRTLNFRMTVRDNNSSYGCTDDDAMVVTVDGGSGPFAITSPVAGDNWMPGSTQTISWDVAGTTAAPVSCANVDILLSTDGGATFPTTLASATPNDGVETVTLPAGTTNQAVILIQCSNNIFFDASGMFSITNDLCTNFVSNDVPKTIPDNTTSTITSTLNTATSGTITDVNLSNLQITHDWIGDLTVSLISPAGTTVQLVDQICGPDDDMSISFDDESSNPYGNIPCPPTDASNYQPQNALSAFDNEGMNGVWTLQIVDHFNQDGGTLDAWGVRICYQSPQPVALSAFTAREAGAANLLSWTSESEQNTARYVVERSSDGELFLPVGEVAAAGNSSVALTYQFYDRQPLPLSYYRLQMQDEDGSVEYSKVVYVQRGGSALSSLRLSPNPTGGEAEVFFVAPHGGPASWRLQDALGRLQKKGEWLALPGENRHALSFADLPKGIYYLHFFFEGKGGVLPLVVR